MSSSGGPIIIIHPNKVVFPRSSLEEILSSLAPDSKLKAEIEAKLSEIEPQKE
jgi:hypothetical protein